MGPRDSSLRVAARPRWLFVIAALGALAALPAPGSAPPDASTRTGLARTISEPRLRVGLGQPRDEVRVGASRGPLAVYDGTSGRPLGIDTAPDRTLLVVPVGRPSGEERVVHRVQVASFRAEPGARRLAAELEREYREPAEAYWEPSRGVWRVRIGSAASPAELGELLASLRDGGHPDAWIVRETSARLVDGKLRVLDESWDALDAPGSRLVFASQDASPVTVDGRAYRGLVEIALTADGRLVAINELNVEDYLRGVVPEELGPAVFPELEALKAQAVAARTYAAGNLGQFAEEGYDICDTPRCQAYGGAASEHPLSDRAVRETRGLVLEYGGRPINAMYTSTCGGHTEDVEIVFPDLEGPYLRGVQCSARTRELARMVIEVEGAPVAPGAGDRPLGGVGPFELARLVAGGLLPAEALEDAWRAAPANAAEVDALVRALARDAGKSVAASGAFDDRRVGAWLSWARLFDDVNGDSGLVPDSGLEAVLAFEDSDSLPPVVQTIVANLLASGVVEPPRDGRLAHDLVPSRDEVIGWLARSAERFGVATPRRGDVVAGSRGRLELRVGRTLRKLRVDALTRLLVESAGGWSLIEKVELMPGDGVLFLADGPSGTETLRLLAVRERASRSDDRRSPRFRWEVVRERREIERSLADVAPVGFLRELKILRRGVSGRVAELEVEGSTGRAVVRGFRLRRALGLPETLFDLDVQREADGLLRRVAFRGRGWGHGVGMCQYGAFGMARRGETFREILSHYYTGARIGRWKAR